MDPPTACAQDGPPTACAMRPCSGPHTPRGPASPPHTTWTCLTPPDQTTLHYHLHTTPPCPCLPPPPPAHLVACDLELLLDAGQEGSGGHEGGSGRQRRNRRLGYTPRCLLGAPRLDTSATAAPGPLYLLRNLVSLCQHAGWDALALLPGSWILALLPGSWILALDCAVILHLRVHHLSAGDWRCVLLCCGCGCHPWPACWHLLLGSF